MLHPFGITFDLIEGIQYILGEARVQAKVQITCEVGDDRTSILYAKILPKSGDQLVIMNMRIPYAEACLANPRALQNHLFSNIRRSISQAIKDGKL